MKVEFFENIETIEELKKQYKKLALLYHPDRGGSLEIMQKINAEYDFLAKNLKHLHFFTHKKEIEIDDNFKEIIQKIIVYDFIEIEICGTWIWISGDTFQIKDTLKSLGFKWRKNKKMWSYGELKGLNRKALSHEEIQNKYGSQKIATKKAILIN